MSDKFISNIKRKKSKRIFKGTDLRAAEKRCRELKEANSNNADYVI